MTPDRAPTVRELLAFYLEAGVDCVPGVMTPTEVERLDGWFEKALDRSNPPFASLLQREADRLFH